GERPRKVSARRLVPGVGLVPEGLAQVVHPGEIVGPPSLEQAQQEVGDPPRRRSILAPTRGEGARDHREERAVDERVSVDQIEGGWGFRHAPKNNARWNEKPRPMARAGRETPNGAGGRLHPNDVLGVQPFLPGLHLELHLLPFRERLETVHLDRREVYEHILAALLLNEAVALGVIEPLHLSLSHSVCLLQSHTWGAEHPA